MIREQEFLTDFHNSCVFKANSIETFSGGIKLPVVPGVFWKNLRNDPNSGNGTTSKYFKRKTQWKS